MELTFCNTNIYITPNRWDVSAYYSSCVMGNSKYDFDFVADATASCISNYCLGQKLYGTITPNFMTLQNSGGMIIALNLTI